jgi:glycosyltransferase involved in cell wall biosynthesis
VLVSISTGEGFGLAGLEAAASGLPVVGLKGTVTEELFPDGSGHVLLDSSEPQQLAGALIRLLTDADHARAIGDAGRRRMREVFTIDQFNQRIRGAITPLIHTTATH